MRSHSTLVTALAFAAWCPAFGQGPPAAPAQDAAAKQAPAADLRSAFFVLQDEFDEAIDAYRAAMAQLRGAAPDAPRPVAPNAAFYPRYEVLADAGSVDAQLWVLQNYTLSPLIGEAARADKRARILRAMASEPSAEQYTGLVRLLGSEAMGRGHLTKEESMALLDLVIASVADLEVQATAAGTQASVIDVRGGTREQRMPAIEAMKAVAARWPETKAGRRAGGAAFAFENLNVGQTAPDIVGADVDGNALKLSDFAGKVVVLDFWGFW